MDGNRNGRAASNKGTKNGRHAGAARRRKAIAREVGEGTEAIEALDDNDDVIGSAQEGLMALGQALEEQIRERPYVTLGAALGVGFVLAQALNSKIGRLALLAAGGFAVTRLVRSDGLQLLEGILGDESDDEDADGEISEERERARVEAPHS